MPEKDTTSNIPKASKPPNYGENRERLTKNEESNLADYLNLGMSICDARAAFQPEWRLLNCGTEYGKIKEKNNEDHFNQAVEINGDHQQAPEAEAEAASLSTDNKND